jgi:phosphoglucosamine mutase
LGRAAARVLDGTTFLVGRDTRISGPMLQAALTAGLTSEGADVVDLGVLPTPAVAAASAARGLPAAMISASHNPYPDNGIKLFSAGGRKLPDEVEERLETELAESAAARDPKVAAELGTVSVDDGAARAAYVEQVLASLDGRRLDGLRLVLDCANGAASSVAGELFRAAGADVSVIHAAPDGTNINHGCGSTYPESLAERVVATNADMGLAFDGDADRVVAVDGTGAVVDGDQVIALCALDLRERGRLTGDAVVVTVMTNLGFRRAMADKGVRVVETAVGDRYVLEALEEGGYSLGGEQSGHVIFRDLATTGDGLLTGLVLSDVVVRSGRPLAALAGEVMTRFPQVLRNVRVAERRPDIAELVSEHVAAAERDLGEQGRVLIRSSGTEPVVRVMVEAATIEQAEAVAERLAGAVANVGPYTP